MITTCFSILMILDHICVQEVNLYKNYSPGFDYKILDSLILIEKREVEQLNFIQNYFKKRIEQSKNY